MRWGLLLVAGLVVVLVGIALGLGLQSTPSYAAAESRASSAVVVSQAAAASSAASQQTADLSSSIEVEKAHRRSPLLRRRLRRRGEKGAATGPRPVHGGLRFCWTYLLRLVALRRSTLG